MEKYIIISGGSGEQFYVAADPIYAEVDTSSTPHRLLLTYVGKQIGVVGASDMVQADADAINAAVAACWSQPYTEPTISATLSQVVTEVAPT
jgi:hypothetical protein|tara:strand:- start:92 stop:367 length:276 start_codon:yes stop_codon:yes gene_type:complete